MFNTVNYYAGRDPIVPIEQFCSRTPLFTLSGGRQEARFEKRCLHTVHDLSMFYVQLQKRYTTFSQSSHFENVIL